MLKTIVSNNVKKLSKDKLKIVNEIINAFLKEELKEESVDE